VTGGVWTVLREMRFLFVSLPLDAILPGDLT
jgi:hypothetical protein